MRLAVHACMALMPQNTKRVKHGSYPMKQVIRMSLLKRTIETGNTLEARFFAVFVAIALILSGLSVAAYAENAPHADANNNSVSSAAQNPGLAPESSPAPIAYQHDGQTPESGESVQEPLLNPLNQRTLSASPNEAVVTFTTSSAFVTVHGQPVVSGSLVVPLHSELSFSVEPYDGCEIETISAEGGPTNVSVAITEKDGLFIIAGEHVDSTLRVKVEAKIVDNARNTSDKSQAQNSAAPLSTLDQNDSSIALQAEPYYAELSLGDSVLIKSSDTWGGGSAWSSSRNDLVKITKIGNDAKVEVISAESTPQDVEIVDTFNFGTGTKKYLIKINPLVGLESASIAGVQSMQIGSSAVLKIATTPADATIKTTWSSSDESLATVDSLGRVVAKNTRGTVVITAEVTGLADNKSIVVEYPMVITRQHVTSVEIIGSNYVLVNKDISLDAKAYPSDVAAGVGFEWVSDDPAIATVNQNGTVFGHSAGTAIIRAMALDGSELYGEKTITVYAADPVIFSIKTAITNLPLSQTYNGVLPDDGTPIPANSLAQHTLNVQNTGDQVDHYLFAGYLKAVDAFTYGAYDYDPTKDAITHFRAENGKAFYSVNGGTSYLPLEGKTVVAFYRLNLNAEQVALGEGAVSVGVSDWPTAGSTNKHLRLRIVEVDEDGAELPGTVYDSGYLNYWNGIGQVNGITFDCDSSRYVFADEKGSGGSLPIKVQHWTSNLFEPSGPVPDDATTTWVDGEEYNLNKGAAVYFDGSNAGRNIIEQNVVTLYVKQRVFNVSYDANIPEPSAGDSLDVPDPETKYAGDMVTVAYDPVPVRQGYTFVGWTFSGSSFAGGNAFHMPANDVVFKANWVENENAISYRSNNVAWGTVTPDGERIISDQDPTGSLAIASLDYKFVGWYENYENEKGVNLLGTNPRFIPQSRESHTYWAVFAPLDGLSVKASNVKTVYDGQGHGVLAKAYEEETELTDAVIRYNDSTGNYTLEESPRFSDAGTYTVEFQATVQGRRPVTGSATVTIEKRHVTLASGSNGGVPWVYDGAEHSDTTTTETCTNIASAPSAFPAGEGVTYGAFPSVKNVTSDTGVQNAPEGGFTLNAGTNPNNYVFTEEWGLLKVVPAELVITAGSAEKTYDGTPLTSNTWTNTALVGSDSVASVVVQGSATNVGDAGVNSASDAVIKNGEETVTTNYRITYNTGKLTILKASLVVPVAGATLTKTYTGETFSVDGFDVDPIALGKATISLKEGKTAYAEGAEANTYSMGLSANDFDVVSQNYDVTLAVTDGWLKINPAGTMTVSAPHVSRTYDGKSHGTVAQASVANATIKYWNEATQQYDLDQSPEFSDWTNGAKTVKFQATHPNYAAALGETSVTINKRQIKAVSGSNGNTPWVYDGTSHSDHSVVETCLNPNPEDATTFPDNQGLVYSSWASVKNVADTASSNNSFSYSFGNQTSSDNYEITLVFGTLSIERRPATLLSADLSKPYDGTKLENGATPLDVNSGWVGSEGVDVTFTASVTLPGEQTANSYTYQPKAGTDLGNYVIDAQYGTLKITHRDALHEVSIEGNSFETVYDGSIHKVQGFKGQTEKGVPVVVDGLTYYVSGLVSEASGSNVFDSVSSIVAVGTSTVHDEFENDVSDQFNVNVTPGKLTIKQRPVTLVSESDEKTYDGTPLTKTEVTIEDDGFVVGEAKAVATGTITDAGGPVENSIEVLPERNYDARNYDFTYRLGTLTVTKASLSVDVVGATNTVTYLASTQSVNGFTTTHLPAGVSVSIKDGFAAKVSGVDVGTYTMDLTSESFDVASKNYDVTLNVTDGWIRITPADLVIKANDSGKTYGQTVEDLSATVSGLKGADRFTGSYEVERAPGEDPGNYEISVKNVAFTNPNYRVSTLTGTFVITPANTASIILPVESKVYDGTPLLPTKFTAVGLQQNDYAEVTFTGSQTNVGTSESSATSIIIRNAAGENVTNRYADVKVVTGKLQVTPRPATIVVNNASKTAGQNDPTFTGTTTGLVNSGDLGDVVYSRTNPSDNAVGVYENVLTASYAANKNYAVEIIPGTFTISPAPAVPVPPSSTEPRDPTPDERPAPGTLPENDPLAPIVNTLKTAIAPLVQAFESSEQERVEALREEAIARNKTPLAGFDVVNCWMHYYMVIGIVSTLLYGAGVLVRRLSFTRKLKESENVLLGKSEQAPSAPSKPAAANGKAV